MVAKRVADQKHELAPTPHFYYAATTVVLFVHGLNSSPATWFPMMNHLRADKEIRGNHQFCFYSYPSGYPYSASIHCKELDMAEKHHPLRRKMVVLAHSMGGCMSHLLVTDSERRIWDRMFTVPPEKMEFSPDHKHIITESTIFEHRPEIGRVIFMSIPHRRSNLADDRFGQMFAKLVKLSATLVNIGIEKARYKTNADGTRYLNRFPDSVETLTSENDFVKALNTIPINTSIPYRPIVGDRGRGDSPNSIDGVVPYWSSHRDGAVSELVVPSNHGAHQNEKSFTEVERILETYQPELIK